MKIQLKKAADMTFNKMSVAQFRRWYCSKRAECDGRGRSLLNTLHATYLTRRNGWRVLLRHFIALERQ